MKTPYLSEAISDEEINSWGAGESVVITSPTGSGKSHFVLTKLLPRAIEAGKHIVYLCNRKILNEQLIATSHSQLLEIFGEGETLSEEQMQAIHIVTYQYCELTRQFPMFFSQQITLGIHNTLYFVFDEAHYFLNDALFNSGTHMWVDRVPTSGINVFLTATPEPLLWFFASGRAKFDYITELHQIWDNYKRKASLRRELEHAQHIEKHMVSIQSKTVSIKKEKQYSTRYIADQCRKIEVYSETFTRIHDLLGEIPKHFKILPRESFPLNYGQMNEFYFKDYFEIADKIKDNITEEKWLIFVDDEHDGIRFTSHLDALGTAAVFLSARTIKRGVERSEFENIVRHKRFSCKVLISTAVMDCGVSIVDPMVKHVVLSHCNKATFLQMLGRRRMQGDEEIRLYIRFHSERCIQGIRHQLETQMRVLTCFALLNSIDCIKVGEATGSWDGMKEVSVLNKSEKNAAIEAISKPKNLALTYAVAQGNQSRRLTTKKNLILEEREYSKTAFLALLHELYNYIEALDSYHKTKDPLFYLKRQLAWIGKEYDESRWVNYAKTREAVLNYLEEHCEKWMEKEEQKIFSAQCLELLLKLPVPPLSLKNNVSRYHGTAKNPPKSPGLKILNAALQEKNFPYEIESWQRYLHDGRRGTCWMVKNKHP